MISIRAPYIVLGESSAGKSSLLNLILGEELLPHHVLHTTSTICELKYGKERKLSAYGKHVSEQGITPNRRNLDLESEKKCEESYEKQIDRFVNLNRLTRELEGSNYEKVQIFWPHEMLEVLM